MQKLFAAALVGGLAVTSALAASSQWQGSGPFATGLGDRVINGLAVSSDGATLYAGTGSGTVFARTANTWAITATANPAPGGSVSCTPNPVVDGADAMCSATPGAGYSFIGWSGDCSGASCVLSSVTAARSVTANFSLNSYLITATANPAAGGTVVCTPNPVNYGGSASCSATPNTGYNFMGWSGDCSGGSCTLANVTAARSVTASFLPNGTKTFTGPSATSSGNVTASFTGGGAACGYTRASFISASAPPPGVRFPHGLFDFSVSHCTAGATLTFTITYPQPLPTDAQYWKYGPTSSNTTPHWYTLPATLSGNQISFSLVDGGLGDDDLTPNGTVADAGGPGVTVDPSATAVPALSGWALALLGVLLGGVTLAGARRRGKRGEI